MSSNQANLSELLKASGVPADGTQKAAQENGQSKQPRAEYTEAA
jgi:hypothetical protein